MRIAIVGGGILGLSLAHYLQRAGHRIDLFERSPYLGGLASSFDYQSFVWDRFYHVILAQDTALVELVEELGLGEHLRWRSTRTGYYAGGRMYSMSDSRELLRFPLLKWTDKLRMGIGTIHAVRFANRDDLYRMTAADWLVKVFGRANYETFWRPLLRAKFGAYAGQVAALTIQATLARLFGARSSVAGREAMGYVRGGYHRILGAFRSSLEAGGASISLGVQIERIGLADEWDDYAVGARAARLEGRADVGGPTRTMTSATAVLDSAPDGACGVRFKAGDSPARTEWYDRVFFTAPIAAALPIVTPRVRLALEAEQQQHDPSARYLGVVCLNVVLRRSLTPFYVLNIADESIPLTGVIEMTSLISRDEETKGLSLVYLPRYVDSRDPLLQASDSDVYSQLFERGLQRLIPDLSSADVVSWHVQRAPYVQPLRLVGPNVPPPGNRRPIECGPFVLANTSLLACPTLNNNEVVALAKQVAARVDA